MKNLIKKILKRKFLTAVAIIVLLGASYYSYGYFFGNKNAISYVTAIAQKGTIVVSVSGGGQVSASNQVDIKPKVSGEITAVYVKLGQDIDARATLVAIDTRDAERTVRDAETALETAKLELDKILEPIDALTLLQAENSFTQAKESKQKAEDNVKKVYEDGFNAISNAFLDFPSIMAGLENTLFANTIDSRSSGGDNITWYVNQTDYQTEQRDKVTRYKNDVYAAYNKARIAYSKNFDSYKSVSRTSDEQVIDTLILETYDTAQFIDEAIKAADNYIDFVQDAMELRHLTVPTMVFTHQSNIGSYTSKVNSILVNLLSTQRALKDAREAIVSADRTIEERELSLAKTKNGPDDLDIRAKKITIQQREDALITAKQTLADHYVRAPFAGVVAKVKAKKGDTVSSGTAIVTLVTKQKIAEISLNEVDVAKVKIGEKSTLLFDALPDLNLTGEVEEIDTIGSVTQGVVTYNVKIGFDTQDERVKPSMSMLAAIITDVQIDVILIPNSAIKSDGNSKYVETLNGSTPRNQPVDLGLSNDIMTEIVSGIKEGDKVITQKITSDVVPQSQQGASGFRIPGRF